MRHLVKYPALHTIKFAENAVTDFAALEVLVRHMETNSEIESVAFEEADLH